MRASTNTAILLRPAARLTQPLTWLILAAVVAAAAVLLSGAGIAQAQDAPAGLTATRGDQSVALGWTDPSNTAITKYQTSRTAQDGLM